MTGPGPPRSLRIATVVLLGIALLGVAGVAPGVVDTATAGPDGAGSEPPALVVAHRGASAEAPEHTGPAYDRGMRAGADVLECDVQVTADDQLVCIHDATVDRTTGNTATGPVDSFTLDQLREMDFGSWFGAEFAGARVVTLEEQINCYRAADPSVQFYVETKTQADQGDRMERLLVELLRRLDMVPDRAPDVRSSPVIIQSFDAESLNTIRRMAPGLPVAFLFNTPTPEIEAGAFPDVDVIAPNHAALDDRPDLLDAAHATGIEVHTWTVDDPARMTELIHAGVDAFFTNVPGTGRQVVDQSGRGSGRRPLDVANPSSSTSSVPECPAGMGLGLRPAADDAAAPDEGGAVAATPDDGSATAATDEGIPIWPIAVGVVLIALAGFVAARRLARSEPRD